MYPSQLRLPSWLDNLGGIFSSSVGDEATASLVIEKNDGSLFGLVDAGQLAEIMTGANSWLSPRDFERWLVEADTAKIKSLPQFIPYYECVWQTSDKRRALEIMNERDVQFWPVRDKEGKFVGIVDRSKLTASMLIDIADRLETKP